MDNPVDEKVFVISPNLTFYRKKKMQK